MRAHGPTLALLVAACGGAPDAQAPPPPSCLAWAGPPVVLTPPTAVPVRQARVVRAGDGFLLAWRTAGSGTAVLARAFDEALLPKGGGVTVSQFTSTGPELEAGGAGAVVAWTGGSPPRLGFRRVGPTGELQGPPTTLEVAEHPGVTGVAAVGQGDAVSAIGPHDDAPERRWTFWQPLGTPQQVALDAAGVDRSGPVGLVATSGGLRAVLSERAAGTWRLRVVDPAAAVAVPSSAVPGAPAAPAVPGMGAATPAAPAAPAAPAEAPPEAPAALAGTELAVLPDVPEGLDAAAGDAIVVAWSVGGQVHAVRVDGDRADPVVDLGTGTAARVAASGPDAVAAWATADGVRLQRLAGGCHAEDPRLDGSAADGPDVTLWGDGEGLVTWHGRVDDAEVAWARRFRLTAPPPAAAP